MYVVLHMQYFCLPFIIIPVLALLYTVFFFFFMKVRCENLLISQNNKNFMACQGYFFIIIF